MDKLPSKAQIKRACAVVADTFEDFPESWNRGSFAANEENMLTLYDRRACKFCALGGVITVLHDSKKYGPEIYGIAHYVTESIKQILKRDMININDIYGRKAAIAALREVAHGG